MEVGFRQQEPRILIDTIALKKKTEKKKDRKKERKGKAAQTMNEYVRHHLLYFFSGFALLVKIE